MPIMYLFLQVTIYILLTTICMRNAKRKIDDSLFNTIWLYENNFAFLFHSLFDDPSSSRSYDNLILFLLTTGRVAARRIYSYSKASHAPVVILKRPR